MSAAEVLLIAILSAWWVLSALAQVPAVSARLRRHDLLALLPAFSFFAPRPGRIDRHLLYRDLLADGSLTPWREVLAAKAWTPLSIIWNPERRAVKALFDIGMQLGVEAQGRKPEEAQLTMPYLLLLNYVSRLPRMHPAVQTQFLVMTSFGALSTREPEVSFLSALHGVD